LNKVYNDASGFLDFEKDGILIRVKQTTGSAPRDTDALMLINENSSFGTVGGGHLEYDAIEKALKFLKISNFKAKSLEYFLGPELGQCCGGRVLLSFDKLDLKLREELAMSNAKFQQALTNVYIFGAGHVGKALAKQLHYLPLRFHLIDSRPEMFNNFEFSENCAITAIPEAKIRDGVPGSAYVILTHDHALDFLLVKEVLMRNDSIYIGMIGSKTKKSVLKNWLQKEDVSGVERVVTPIGSSLRGSSGLDKRPDVIAVFVAAEILAAIQSNKTSNSFAGNSI